MLSLFFKGFVSAGEGEEGMKRLQSGAGSDPAPSPGPEAQQSQSLSSKPSISPQKKLLPYEGEKYPFFSINR